MNPDHAVWTELAAAAALDALDPVDRAAFARHLAEGCAECALREHAFRLVALRLLEVPAPIEPPAGLPARILASARAPIPLVRPRTRGWRDTAVRLALAASVAAALGLGYRVRGLEDSQAQARARISALEADNARSLARVRFLEIEQATSQERVRILEAENVRAQSVVARVLSPDARTVAMNGQGAATGARAAALLDRATGALTLLAADLPALGADQGYELWWIDAGVAHPAGVFVPDSSGRAFHEFRADQPLANTAVLAVTIEPRAGVSAPTGAIVLAQR